jgi:hypothetical protein
MMSTHEDDAYFHPGGTIRSLADATLDGWRPEPTIVLRRVRARSRRSWLFLGLVALLVPLLLVGLIAGMSEAAPAAGRMTRLHTVDPTRAALVLPLTSRAAMKTRDVRSLPPARRPAARTR